MTLNNRNGEYINCRVKLDSKTSSYCDKVFPFSRESHQQCQVMASAAFGYRPSEGHKLTCPEMHVWLFLSIGHSSLLICQWNIICIITCVFRLPNVAFLVAGFEGWCSTMVSVVSLNVGHFAKVFPAIHQHSKINFRLIYPVRSPRTLHVFPYSSCSCYCFPTKTRFINWHQYPSSMPKGERAKTRDHVLPCSSCCLVGTVS